MGQENKRVEASRRMEAPATRIFEILANPHRHMDFDGSGMLRGAVLDHPISEVGDTFTMKMHRLGDDYLMLNYVVEFEPDRQIFWEPAPGDASRAENDDPAKIGIPAGYRWGYILTSDGDDATVVTEVFDCGPLPEDLFSDGGTWINGHNSMRESMTASLERLLAKSVPSRTAVEERVSHEKQSQYCPVPERAASRAALHGPGGPGHAVGRCETGASTQPRCFLRARASAIPRHGS